MNLNSCSCWWLSNAAVAGWLRIRRNVPDRLFTCDFRFSKPVQVLCELASAALVVTVLSNRKLAGSDQILLAWDLAFCWVVFNMSQHLISSALLVSQLNPFCCGPVWRSHILFFNHLQAFLCSNKHAAGLLCSEFPFIGIAGVQREPLTDALFIWLAYRSFYMYKMILIIKLDMNMQDLSAGLVLVLLTDNL